MTVTLETQFSETAQSEPWKNGVAEDLNILLQICRDKFDPAILRVVRRVAESEEITVLQGEE